MKGLVNKFFSFVILNSDRVINIDGTTASYLYEVMNINGEESVKKKMIKFIKWMKVKGIEFEMICLILVIVFMYVFI